MKRIGINKLRARFEQARDNFELATAEQERAQARADRAREVAHHAAELARKIYDVDLAAPDAEPFNPGQATGLELLLELYRRHPDARLTPSEARALIWAEFGEPISAGYISQIHHGEPWFVRPVGARRGEFMLVPGAAEVLS